jgi:hypothetical protein
MVNIGGVLVSARELDPDTMLSDIQASEALAEKPGLRIAATTLQTKRSRGGGPPYQKFGPHVRYKWGSLLAWAQSQLTPEVDNTAQFRALNSPAKLPGPVDCSRPTPPRPSNILEEAER